MLILRHWEELSRQKERPMKLLRELKTLNKLKKNQKDPTQQWIKCH
jgi:hypothetical protein